MSWIPSEAEVFGAIDRLGSADVRTIGTELLGRETTSMDRNRIRSRLDTLMALGRVTRIEKWRKSASGSAQKHIVFQVRR